MNRHALPVVLTLVLVAFVTACQPTVAPDTNRDAARTATASPTKEPVDRAAIEAAVTRLEMDWVETIKTHNPDVVKRVLADDVVMTYPDGATGTKADEIRDNERAAFTADAWDVVESHVNVLDADAAVVTGRTIIKNGKYKTPDNKTIEISGEYRFTDVFARRNGSWQVVASQATKIVNPTPAASPKASPAGSASAPSAPPAKAASPAATKTP